MDPPPPEPAKGNNRVPGPSQSKEQSSVGGIGLRKWAVFSAPLHQVLTFRAPTQGSLMERRGRAPSPVHISDDRQLCPISQERGDSPAPTRPGLFCLTRSVSDRNRVANIVTLGEVT